MCRLPEMPFIRKHLVFLWLKVKADEILTSHFQAVDRGLLGCNFIRQLEGNRYPESRLLNLECLMKVGSLNRFIEVHDCL